MMKTNKKQNKKTKRKKIKGGDVREGRTIREVHLVSVKHIICSNEQQKCHNRSISKLITYQLSA